VPACLLARHGNGWRAWASRTAACPASCARPTPRSGCRRTSRRVGAGRAPCRCFDTVYQKFVLCGHRAMCAPPRVAAGPVPGVKLGNLCLAGDKETRAWTIRRGMTAPQAAGVIHTDFEKVGHACDLAFQLWPPACSWTRASTRSAAVGPSCIAASVSARADCAAPGQKASAGSLANEQHTFASAHGFSAAGSSGSSCWLLASPQGFIRAETIAYNDFIKYNGFSGAAGQGCTPGKGMTIHTRLSIWQSSSPCAASTAIGCGRGGRHTESCPTLMFRLQGGRRDAARRQGVCGAGGRRARVPRSALTAPQRRKKPARWTCFARNALCKRRDALQRLRPVSL
jgi:hypothetical protein